jgi:hypothetical protein
MIGTDLNIDHTASDRSDSLLSGTYEILLVNMRT